MTRHFHRTLLGILLLTFTLASASAVMALASVDQIAFKGKPVTPDPNWPEGVLEMVNDPYGPRDGIPGSANVPMTFPNTPCKHDQWKR